MSTTESAAPTPRQVTREDADRMLDEIDAAIGGGDPHFECHQELTPIELVQQVMSRTPASFDANALATLARQVEALTVEREKMREVVRVALAWLEAIHNNPDGRIGQAERVLFAALAGKEVGSDGE